MKPSLRGASRAETHQRFAEQLGVAGASWGVAHAHDLLEKALPGALARLRVAREDENDGLWSARPFVEQLGVASGKRGLRKPSDAAKALFGLYARWSVARQSGIDYRALARELIEHQLLQVPMRAKRKALLLSIAYALAAKLPDTR
jgi:hypothetical protein